VQSPLQVLFDSIDHRALAEPPAELRQFAKEETFGQEAGRDRRRYRRYSLITNVIAVPLDERLCPVGDPFVSLSSGMSVDGIRLIHTDPAQSDYLFIAIESQPVRFVLSVLRSRPVGSCYEIAGRLLNAGALEHKLGLPILESAPCGGSTVIDADTGTLNPLPPALDEIAHWAGVTAAIDLLRADPRRNSLQASPRKTDWPTVPLR
jgi:hypothetical protein